MGELMKFFRNNQDNLARNHHRMFVLIREPKEPKIVSFYPTYQDAYASAVFEDEIPPEPFLIHRCLRADEEQPAVFHSRVL